jgi:hypothetical protein
VFEAISTFLGALSGAARGVRKNGETRIRKPGNRNREIGEPVPVEKKKPKPGTPILVLVFGTW